MMHDPTIRPFPANEPTVRPKTKRPWAWLLVLLLGGLLLTAVASGAALFYASPLLLPGTQLMGTAVGLQPQNDATHRLSEQWQQQQLTVESPTAHWLVSPAELGIQLDPHATITDAYQHGRSWAGLQTLLQTGSLVVPPRLTLDTAVATAYLQQLANQIAQPTSNATIQFVGGQAVALPPAAGHNLDMAATLRYLEEHQQAIIAHGRLPLSLVITQPDITDATAVANQINQSLQQPLTLSAYDPIQHQTETWVLPATVWGHWLQLTPQAGTEPWQWSFDSQQLTTFLSERSATLGHGRYLELAEALPALERALLAVVQASATPTAVDLRIYHHPSQYIVQAGDSFASIGHQLGIPYPWIQQANPGIHQLNPGQQIQIPSPDALLPLPVVRHKRIVVSISQQKAYLYEADTLKWEWPASTGISSSPTSPGIFQVQTHQPEAYAANWDLWMPHFVGIYRPVPTSDFMNGFHGFPTRDGYNLLWTNNLGTPVTYGCILLSNENAQLLYSWAEAGVIVEVIP